MIEKRSFDAWISIELLELNLNFMNIPANMMPEEFDCWLELLVNVKWVFPIENQPPQGKLLYNPFYVYYI